MATYLLKNIPDDLHRKIKSVLAAEGKTLRQYLLECIQKKAKEPKK